MSVRQLRVALFVEGATDERFLPRIVQRTIEDILLARQQVEVRLLEPEIIKPLRGSHETHAQAILQAAELAAGHDLLILHSDVDKRTWQETYDQLIASGLELVEQARAENGSAKYCQQIIAVLPIRMIEAWLLADAEKLRETIGTDKTSKELGLPKLSEVERRADPKSILNNAVRIAEENRPRRRRGQSSVAGVYAQMADVAELAKLRKLEAFQKFEEALTQALEALGL
jgi:hypothetical protein